MYKSILLITVVITLVLGIWFVNTLNTDPTQRKIEVTNLPWQIEVIDEHTTKILNLEVGRTNLEQAIDKLGSEYKLAWFENPDDSISLEAYFSRVNLSNLRAKIVLELDTSGLTVDYLKQHSGKAEILTSKAIKYPLDALVQTLSDRKIRSITYIPLSSLEPDLLGRLFGEAIETIKLDEQTTLWFYPQKGLMITINQKGKEAFQYVPVSDFNRLKQNVPQQENKEE